MKPSSGLDDRGDLPLLLNPHGSDETIAQDLTREINQGFLTHTVQMKPERLLLSGTPADLLNPHGSDETRKVTAFWDTSRSS